MWAVLKRNIPRCRVDTNHTLASCQATSPAPLNKSLRYFLCYLALFVGFLPCPPPASPSTKRQGMSSSSKPLSTQQPVHLSALNTLLPSSILSFSSPPLKIWASDLSPQSQWPSIWTCTQHQPGLLEKTARRRKRVVMEERWWREVQRRWWEGFLWAFKTPYVSSWCSSWSWAGQLCTGEPWWCCWPHSLPVSRIHGLTHIMCLPLGLDGGAGCCASRLSIGKKEKKTTINCWPKSALAFGAISAEISFQNESLIFDSLYIP